jgi:hypothetical protein
MTALLDHPAVAHGWPCAEIHKTSTRYEVEVRRLDSGRTSASGNGLRSGTAPRARGDHQCD